MDDNGVRSQVQFLLHEAVGAGVGGGSSGNKMPTLEEYGTNLTKLAEEGKLDPVVGRQDQIERVTRILGRHTKNNPCLIGEPGVGKIAIAEGLALRIANGDVPKTIQGKKVITLDVGLLVAGTKYRGEFEERLKKLMEEIKQRDDIILFIDEVHTLIGAGAAEGANDAANILKPTLALGELQIIQIKNLPRKNSVIGLKDYWQLELWATQILQKIMRTKLYKIRTRKSYRTSNVPLQIFQNSVLKKQESYKRS